MNKHILIIGGLKSSDSKQLLLSNFMYDIANKLSSKFKKVYFLNSNLRLKSNIKQVNFNLNDQNFTNFLLDSKIDHIFTLSPGQGVQNFINDYFSNHLDLLNSVKFVGTDFKTLNTLTDNPKLAKLLEKRHFKYPQIQVLNAQEALNIDQNQISLPIRLRVLSKNHLKILGLFHDFSSLKESINNYADQEVKFQLEESAFGDKEVEVIAIKDYFQSTIVLGQSEKLDPVGVHKNNSFVIYPTVTLLAREKTIIDNIVKDIFKDLTTPIIKVCFSISKENGYRILSINNKLTTSELNIAKVKNLDLASIIVDISCGSTLLDLSEKYLNLLSGDSDFFYIAAPYNKLITDPNRKINTSLIVTVENNLVIAIRNSLIQILDIPIYEMLTYLSSLSDNFLVKKMLDFRSFRIFYILEAIHRDFLLNDINELTKIDLGFIKILKDVTKVLYKKDHVLENGWQSTNTVKSNLLYPIIDRDSFKFKARSQEITIIFDIKKVSYFFNIYRFYLNRVIDLLISNDRKVILFNNSFDYFAVDEVMVFQIPINNISLPININEFLESQERSYEFGVIKKGNKQIISNIYYFANEKVSIAEDQHSILEQIDLKDLSLATYNFDLNEDGKVINLKVKKSLSKAFYFDPQQQLDEVLKMFVDQKLHS